MCCLLLKGNLAIIAPFCSRAIMYECYFPTGLSCGKFNIFIPLFGTVDCFFARNLRFHYKHTPNRKTSWNHLSCFILLFFRFTLMYIPFSDLQFRARSSPSVCREPRLKQIGASAGNLEHQTAEDFFNILHRPAKWTQWWWWILSGRCAASNHISLVFGDGRKYGTFHEERILRPQTRRWRKN